MLAPHCSTCPTMHGVEHGRAVRGQDADLAAGPGAPMPYDLAGLGDDLAPVPVQMHGRGLARVSGGME